MRSYTPRSLERPLPGVLYMHSGGFVLGSIEGEHARAASLALALGRTRLCRVSAGPGASATRRRSTTASRRSAGWSRTRTSSASTEAASPSPARARALAWQPPWPCSHAIAAGPSVLPAAELPRSRRPLETPSMIEFTDTPVWDRQSAAAQLAALPRRSDADDVPSLRGSRAGGRPLRAAAGVHRDVGVRSAPRRGNPVRAAAAAGRRCGRDPQLPRRLPRLRDRRDRRDLAAKARGHRRALRHGLNGWSGAPLDPEAPTAF